MNEKRENSDIVFSNLRFNKFNTTDEEFNEFSADAKLSTFKTFSRKLMNIERVAQWLVTRTQTPKAPGSSLAAGYEER